MLVGRDILPFYVLVDIVSSYGWVRMACEREIGTLILKTVLHVIMKTTYSGKPLIQLPFNYIYALLVLSKIHKFLGIFSLQRGIYLSLGYFFQKHELSACKLHFK